MYEMRQSPMARQPYQGPSPCRLEPRSDLTRAYKRRRSPEPKPQGSARWLSVVTSFSDS